MGYKGLKIPEKIRTIISVVTNMLKYPGVITSFSVFNTSSLHLCRFFLTSFPITITGIPVKIENENGGVLKIPNIKLQIAMFKVLILT